MRKGTHTAVSLLLFQDEWLLLFNSILPFREVLSSVVQLPVSRRGLRTMASTEAVS